MPVVTEKFEAVVSAIEFEDDADNNRGLIEILCQAITGDATTPLPQLAAPAHDWGWFYMPDVGEQVEIEFVVSSDRDEVWGQTQLEALTPTWRSKRYLTDPELEDDSDGSVPSPIHDDFVSTNYGKRRGFSTPFGHVLLFDDTEGDQRVYLTHMVEKLEPGATPDPAKHTRIEIEPDGSLKVAFLNKHQLHFTTEKGNVKIALDGEPGSEKHTIEFDAETPKFKVSLAEGDSVLTLDGAAPSFEASMDGGNQTIKLKNSELAVKTKGGGNALQITNDDADSSAVIGNGAVHAVIAEHLESFYSSKIKPYIDEHIHVVKNGITTVSGGSGAPAVGVFTPATSDPPTEPAPDWDDAANSSHLAFPDG